MIRSRAAVAWAPGQPLDVTGRHATVAGHLDVFTPEERGAAAVRDTQDRQLAKSQWKFAPLE